MKTAALAFDLPETHFARVPPEARGIRRDEVRLLVTSRRPGASHRYDRFFNLASYLDPGDLVVVNNSRTIPASLPARIGEVPVRLHLSNDLKDGRWVVEVRTTSGAPYTDPLPAGAAIEVIGASLKATVIRRYRDFARLWMVEVEGDPLAAATQVGSPIRYPYVQGEWPLRYYQAMFAKVDGSAEMPSAGRPITLRVLRSLRARGVEVAEVTLHTGVSSHELNRPEVEDHATYPEWYHVPEETACANTMECKRLDDARRHRRGETHDISHHASVPLASGKERFGLLNVAHPGKRGFSEQELALLESVALQIGTAIARVRLLQAQRDQARMEERNRLARDLHDAISQSLFSLNLLAQGARKLVHERPDEAARALEEIHALAQESLQAMRSLIWQLRPEGLEQGLVTALTQYGERLGLRVEVAVEGSGAVPQAVEEALWRIGQEALNNVRRHAGVDRVQVRYAVDRETATLIVRDAGVGFNAREPRGAAPGRGSFGLIGMRERAQSLGGDVTIRSRPGVGTEVRAVIPVSRDAAPGVPAGAAAQGTEGAGPGGTAPGTPAESMGEARAGKRGGDGR